MKIIIQNPGSNEEDSIIITAFVGILPTIIFVVGTENVSQRIYFFLVGIHCILTTGFVFASLNHFGILNHDNMAHIIIFFLVIYITAHMIAEFRTKKMIDELNKRINATHQD